MMDPRRITNPKQFAAWQKEWEERMVREHEERMAAWEYLRSDEHRQKITDEILGEATDGDPPWEDD